jgi:hypothetical protein
MNYKLIEEKAQSLVQEGVALYSGADYRRTSTISASGPKTAP